MPIDVSIANYALSRLGEDDQLVDPGDESKAGRTVRASWAITRRAALREHDWNFAQTRAALAAQAGGYVAASIAPWRFRYPLPADFIRLARVLEPALAGDDYRIEGGAFLTTTRGALSILYVRDHDEPTGWDALFVDAFAWRLAWQMADRLTGDRARKRDAWDGYEKALKRARAADAKENPPEELPMTSWEAARFGSGFGPAPFGPYPRFPAVRWTH